MGSSQVFKNVKVVFCETFPCALHSTWSMHDLLSLSPSSLSFPSPLRRFYIMKFYWSVLLCKSLRILKLNATSTGKPSGDLVKSQLAICISHHQYLAWLGIICLCSCLQCCWMKSTWSTLWRRELKNSSDPTGISSPGMGGRWDRGGRENRTVTQTKTLQGQLGLSALQTLGDAYIDLRVALRMVHECLALFIWPTTPIPLTRLPLGIEWIPCPHFKINKTSFPQRPDKNPPAAGS